MIGRMLRMLSLVAVVAMTGAACGGGGSDRDGKVSATPSGEGADHDEPVVQGSPPTPETLAGIWHAESALFGSFMGLFDPDGTFAFDQEGLLDTDPGFAGTYEIDGRKIVLSYTKGDFTCLVLEAGLPEDGLLHTVTIDDPERPPECRAGPQAGDETTYIRVSPSSAAAAEITAEADSEEGPPPSSESEVVGIWLLEGTGHLLRFSADGTYALDDGGLLATDPDDLGTFDPDGGTLTLTSGPGSRTCAEGTSWVWKDVRLIDGAGTLEGIAGEDSCERGLGPELAWVRLSP